jgi:hypothetical protein
VSALPKLEEECFFIAPIGADGSDERRRFDVDGVADIGNHLPLQGSVGSVGTAGALGAALGQPVPRPAVGRLGRGGR